MSDFLKQRALDYGHAYIHRDKVDLRYARVSTLHYVNTFLQREKGCRLGAVEKTYIESSGTVCNGVPPLHDNLHKVNIKYGYCVRTNTILS